MLPVLAEKQQQNNNFIVFGLTRSGLEPTIYRTRGEHANQYATDAVINKLLKKNKKKPIYDLSHIPDFLVYVIDHGCVFFYEYTQKIITVSVYYVNSSFLWTSLYIISRGTNNKIFKTVFIHITCRHWPIQKTCIVAVKSLNFIWTKRVTVTVCA